jgi:biopolymer transport protein TolR
MMNGENGLAQMRSRINVTPLVDVLLVLLIIFIMVTPILTKAMQSDIPRKADQPLPADYVTRQLVIHVRADGCVRLNHEELETGHLTHRLRTLFQQRGGRRVVFLDADEDAAYETIIRVMDSCRDAGAETIGVIPDSPGIAPR